MSNSSAAANTAPQSQSLVAAAALAPAPSQRAQALLRADALGPVEARALRGAAGQRSKHLGQALVQDEFEFEAHELGAATASVPYIAQDIAAAMAGTTSVGDAERLDAGGEASPAAAAIDAAADAAPANASPLATASSNPAPSGTEFASGGTQAAESNSFTWALGALGLAGVAAAAGSGSKTPDPVLAPVASLAAASNSGSLADNITNAQKPIISGTGTPGQTIQVTTPTGEVLRIQVAADGTWQVQAQQALPEGANAINVVQMDAAGTTSPAVVVTVVVDSTPSVAAAPQIALATDTGAADGITQSSTPAIEGTGTAGDVVTVLIAGQTLTTTVGADGRWSVTPQALGDGKHAAEVTFTDIAGNISPVAVLGLTVDSTAPVLTINPVAGDNLINAAERSAVMLSGTTTAEAGQTVSVSFGDGAKQINATALVMADGTWALTQGADLSGLAQGAITVTANVSDVAGNASVTATHAIAVDASAPVLAIAGPVAGDNLINAAERSAVMLSGTSTAEAGQTVSVRFSDGTTHANATAVVAPDGTWALTQGADLSGLAQGAITVTANVSDLAGNAAPAVVATAQLDSQAPFRPSVDAFYTNNTTPEIHGSTATGLALEAGETLTVSINGATYAVTPNSDTNWRVNLETAVPINGALAALVDGHTYAVTATVTDSAGNATSNTRADAVMVDTTPPAAPTVNDITTIDTTPVITGTTGTGAVLAAGTILHVYVAGATYRVTPDSQGNWSVDLDTAVPEFGSLLTLQPGTHYYAGASVYDAAGNEASSTGAVFIESIQNTAPMVDNVLTRDTSPVITGSTATGTALPAGQMMAVTVNGAAYDVTPGSDGRWSLNLETATPSSGTLAALQDGQTYTVSAVVLGGAGEPARTDGALRIDTSIAAIADSATMTEDSEVVTGNVFTNDTALDGSEVATLAGPATGTYGSLVLAANGSYTYTRNANANGLLETAQERFVYSVTDAAGNTTQQELTVDITPVNDAPTWTGTSPTISIVEQTSTTLNGRGMVFNDVDAASSSVLQLIIAGNDQDVLSLTAGSSGVSVVSGDGSSTLVVSGTLAQLNGLLASEGAATGTLNYSTLAYTAATAEGRDASLLTFVINDMGNTGAGVALSDARTLAVEITADTAPIVASGGFEAVTVGGLGDDTLSAGDAFRAALYGGSGNDVLRGGFDSELHGGSGNDVLVSNNSGMFSSMEGGAGDDQFVISQGDDHFLGHGGSIITDFHREAGNMDSLLLSGLVDADGNGVVNASDLNHSNGANAINFTVSGADLIMRIDSMGAGQPMMTRTVIQGGASYYTTSSADTLASLLASSALALDPVYSVSIPPANHAPTWAGTGSSVSLAEQTTTTLNGLGLAIADVDAGSALMQLTIAGQSQDVLGLTEGNSGVTVVSGAGSSSLVLSGTLAQLNALLASPGGSEGTLHYSTLAYTAETAEGRDTSELSFTINDLGNTGSGGALSATQTVAVAITATNATQYVDYAISDQLLVGGLGNDVYRSFGPRTTMYGGSGDDRLYGDGVDAQLFGGTGNDVLWAGGDGTSTLNGGAGDDLFLIQTINAGPAVTTITDFHRSTGDMDTLRLEYLLDTNGDGAVTASDLNVARVVWGTPTIYNAVEFEVAGNDLIMRTGLEFHGSDYSHITTVTGGASFYSGDSASTLTSLLGSGVLTLDPSYFYSV